MKSSIYIQISAGRGPAECCWVVAQVSKLIIREIEERNLSYEIVDQSPGQQNSTYQSIIIKVKGNQLKENLGGWQGTILWKGQSPFRKFHKRKNWFIGVTFFDLPKSKVIHEHEVTFQSFRASGPGGQHRNKVETAIRATHSPTKLSVTSTESRSQLQNKKGAFEKLKLLINEQNIALMKGQINEKWKSHLALERGNAVRVFLGEKFIKEK